MPGHLLFRHSSLDVPKSPSALSDHLGYWLRKLSNAVSSSFAGRLAAHDVSVPQWVVLRVLYDHDSLPLKDIVARVEVDQGSLSRMMDRLIARGWIRRSADATDRRAVAISLTPQGRRLVPKLADEADRNEAVFFSGLEKTEREVFLRTIQKLLEQSRSDGRSPVT
jgi:DNA-binding MarR family transcriptional regulator